jgi:hypothetical protein
LDFSIIDLNRFSRKIVAYITAAGCFHPTNQAVLQCVGHKGYFIGSGPAQFYYDRVDMSASRAGLGKLGRGLIEQLSDREILKVRAFRAGSAGTAWDG